MIPCNQLRPETEAFTTSARNLVSYLSSHTVKMKSRYVLVGAILENENISFLNVDTKKIDTWFVEL